MRSSIGWRPCFGRSRDGKCSSALEVKENMSRTTEFTIGQVASKAGIRTSKIRYYESVGLLKAVPRVGGRRVFSGDVLEALLLIQFAQEAGFTLAEIRQLLNGFDRRTPASARWQKMATRKLSDVRSLIDRARRMEHALEQLLECECLALSDCVALRKSEGFDVRRGNA